MITLKNSNKVLVIAEHEINVIKNNIGLCQASVERIFKNSDFSFDNIETITQTFENYNWGSNKDRAYRKASIKKAIRLFQDNPLNYIQF